ncbi:IS3 family transposase [Deinococcus humi]|uniref:IS3 family transposase n=1 Tax=Deinococcus humi TaxID=662880 RepID=UPI001C862380
MDSARCQEEARLTNKIKFYFDRSRETYSTFRLKAGLAEEDGLQVSRRRIGRLMGSANLRVRCKRNFRTTTQSKHSYSVAENILNRNFQASAPNQKWVTDITYLPYTDGWLYLATVMDLYSRKIVGWAMHERLETVLVTAALHMAVYRRRPGAVRRGTARPCAAIGTARATHTDQAAEYSISCARRGLKSSCPVQRQRTNGPAIIRALHHV